MASPYVWDQATSTWITASAAGITSSPLTTKGDVWGYSTTDARIPVGADGDVLTADSTQALGVKYAPAAAAGVSSLDSITGAVTLVAGSNVTITDNSPSAGDITIAASTSGTSGLVNLYESTLSSAGTFDTGAGGIASGHGDLLIYAILRSSRAANFDAILVTFNNDTTAANYASWWTRNSGGSVTAVLQTGVAGANCMLVSAANESANYPGEISMRLPRYDKTTYNKMFDASGGHYSVTAGVYDQVFSVSQWASTAAISRVAIVPQNSATFAIGSSVVIYGTQ